MIQPRMPNNKEVKVACFRGKPLYVTSISKKGTHGFTHPPHTPLFMFVENALNDLKTQRPGLIWEGLMRVDVFQDAFGDFKVNEFESLEASYGGGALGGIDNEHTLTEKLRNYWVEIITSLN